MGICLIVKSGGGTDTFNATATADKILSGYTIYSNDNKVTGSMTNVGTQTASGLNTGGNIAVKAGWHNGTGTVTTNTLSSQTQCDIPNQWWCLTGYSYWANGSKYDGAMVNRGAKTWTIGANGSQTIEGGWHNGSGTVKQSINVDNGEWGPTPTTTNQQLCWQGWYYSKNRWCWGSGNLTTGNIRSGVSIFGVSGSWSGWVDSTIQWNAIGASTATCVTGEYIIDYSNATPSDTPFKLVFGLALYRKLINNGMRYINWDATTATYRTRNYDAPLIRLNCTSIFKKGYNSSYYADYPTGVHGFRTSQVPFKAINLYGSINTGSYGADNTTSGKYDIKPAYDAALAGVSGLTDCTFELRSYIYTNGGGDGYTATHGRVFVRSFNCWFSKS